MEANGFKQDLYRQNKKKNKKTARQFKFPIQTKEKKVDIIGHIFRDPPNSKDKNISVKGFHEEQRHSIIMRISNLLKKQCITVKSEVMYQVYYVQL